MSASELRDETWTETGRLRDVDDGHHYIPMRQDRHERIEK